MYCTKCGAQNGDGQKFCTKCGAKMVLQDAVQPSAAHPGGRTFGAEQGVPLPQQVGQAAAQSAAGSYRAASAPYGTYAQPKPPTPQPPYGGDYGGGAAPVAYQEGCAAAAWHDVKGTQGWFKKILLLGLIFLVPILNWVVPGYALRWARDLSFGKREPMPKEVFRDRAFVTGFFAILLLVIANVGIWIASYVLGLVVGAASRSYAMVSVVGTGMGVVSLFLSMFVSVCIIRMAVVDNLGAGFSLGKCWNMFSKNLGKVFCANVVPALLVFLAVGGIVIALTLVFSVVLIGSAAGAASSGSIGASTSVGMQRLLGMVLSYGLVGILYLLFVGYLSSVGCVLATIITYRALGHLVARHAPEWAAEPTLPHGSYGTIPSYEPPRGGSFTPAPTPAPAPVPVPAPMPTPSVSPLPASAPIGGGVSEQRFGQHSDTDTSLLVQPESTSASLVLVRSDGRQYVVSRFPATIGKGSAANVCIDGNETISRVHVRISLAGTSFVVEDLGAKNGTYLNGSVLAEGELVVLREGDALRLGGETFTVRRG